MCVHIIDVKYIYIYTNAFSRVLLREKNQIERGELQNIINLFVRRQTQGKYAQNHFYEVIKQEEINF